MNKTDNSNNSDLCWVETIKLNKGIKLRLIGFNTALLAQDEHDFEKLELGNQQLSLAFDPQPHNDEIVIVLTHHPFSWLKDRHDVIARVRKYAHLHLCGHIHESNVERLITNSGDFLTIFAGAAHQIEETKYGYSFGAIGIKDDGQVFVRYWPRLWSKKNHGFRPDVDNLKDEESYADQDIRLKLSNASSS